MFIFLWLRENPKGIPKVLMIMGFLPFAIGPFHLYMAGIFWYDWSGHVKGAEFSILDAIALALYLALPGPRYSIPFRISMVLYLSAVLLSVAQARFPMAAIFYAWQLARVFLVYAAVARGCSRPGCPAALLKGMTAGLMLQAAVALWDRFGLGILQADGIAGHQNILGLTTHFAAFPLFALLIAAQRGWVPTVGTMASVIIQALTTSRATVGLAVFGYIVVFAFSAVRRWTTRTTLVLAIGVAILGALTPFVIASFERRFEIAGVTYDERGAFTKAASMIISDYPWGVGASHYVLVANVDGYNGLAGVAPIYGSSSTNVHNVYLLVAAETGYLGLIAFVLVILSPMVVAFRCAFRHQGDERCALLIGLGTALLTVYLHSFFEWILVLVQAQYLWALDVGMVAGLAQQLGYWKKPERDPRHSFRGIRFRVGGALTYHGTDRTNARLDQK
jgi:O-antigen ligase